MNNAGFTLVELMVVVGIIGVLASIALPQYKKFTAKSRQTEVKLALGSAYTLEQSFATEQSSFTSCIGKIGFSRDGSKFYYAIGAKNGTACAADGSQNCHFTSFTFTAGAWTGVGACTDNTDGEDRFSANIADTGGTVKTGADAQGVTGVATSKSAFTIGAVGQVIATKDDKWTIDENKNVANVLPGI